MFHRVVPLEHSACCAFVIVKGLAITGETMAIPPRMPVARSRRFMITFSAASFIIYT